MNRVSAWKKRINRIGTGFIMRATGAQKKHCSRSLNIGYMTAIFADVDERDRDAASNVGGKRRRERLRRVGEARPSVCFVSDSGAMIDDAVNDILLDRHFGGSIDNANG